MKNDEKLKALVHRVVTAEAYSDMDVCALIDLVEELYETVIRVNQLTDSIIERYDLDAVAKTASEFTMVHALFLEHLQNYKNTKKSLDNVEKILNRVRLA